MSSITTAKTLHTLEQRLDPKPSGLTTRITTTKPSAITAMAIASVLLANACGAGAPIGESYRADPSTPEVHESDTDSTLTSHTDSTLTSLTDSTITSHTDSTLTSLTPNAVVERVVDGDTFTVKIGGRSEPVRLLGIDTPESVARTRPVQCYGEEASLRLAELLPVGTDVTLVRDIEARDAYNRLLAYVVRSDDELFVNLKLVDEGYAAILNYPPNDHYADVLQRAESAARAAGRGLWSACGGPDVPLN